jgi:hypothetical protein
MTTDGVVISSGDTCDADERAARGALPVVAPGRRAPRGARCGGGRVLDHRARVHVVHPAVPGGDRYRGQRRCLRVEPLLRAACAVLRAGAGGRPAQPPGHRRRGPGPDAFRAGRHGHGPGGPGDGDPRGDRRRRLAGTGTGDRGLVRPPRHRGAHRHGDDSGDGRPGRPRDDVGRGLVRPRAGEPRRGTQPRPRGPARAAGRPPGRPFCPHGSGARS